MKFHFWLAFRLLFSRQIFFAGSAPLAFLGLVLGVAALVVSMAVMSGFVETFKTAMTDTSGDLRVVRRGRLIEDWGTFSKELLAADNRIQAAMKFSYTEAVLASKGQISGVIYQGVDGNQFSKVLNLSKRVKAGQINFSGEALNIGSGLAKKFQLKVGDKIYLVVPLATPFGASGFKRQSQEFTISSILDFGKNDWNERLVISDISSLQKITEIGDRYTGAFVKLQHPDMASEVARTLNINLGAGYSIATWYDINRAIFEAVVLERAVIFLVVLLIVIVAAFNISSTLYVFIRQKYSDIAILKTLGISPKKIRYIFLIQGMIVGVIGTALGIILGYDLCYGFMYLQDHYALISGSVYRIDRIDTSIRAIDLTTICLATWAICLMATYFPAYKGSQLEVIDGLRNG